LEPIFGNYWQLLSKEKQAACGEEPMSTTPCKL